MPEDRNVLIAAATLSNKPKNQDSFALIENDLLNLKGIVIADGIGSLEKSNLASEFVAKYVCQYINSIKFLQDINFEIIFIEAKNNFLKYISENDDFFSGNKDCGTTLIVVLTYFENEHYRIKIGYLGNGAIWHIRGNFNQFNESQILPWSSINYLNPHTLQQEGDNPLYKSITSSSDYKEIIPTTLDINNDENFGDIIMLCTDGIYSYDQVEIGRDKKGNIWINGEKSMDLFYSHIKLLFSEFKEFSTDQLEETLKKYLADLNESGSLEDDATIGIIILPKVFEYQQKIKDAEDSGKQLL